MEAGKFNRIASFVVASQIDPNSNTDLETAAEIVASSIDGNTLIYSNSPQGTVGFVDITDPSNPQPLGEIDVEGEPTSVTVLGNYVLVAVNTSESFVNPSGQLRAIDLSTQTIVQSWDIGGQPDSIAVSPDGNYAVIAIENERDEDLEDGGLPQNPAGFVVIVDTSSDNLADWTTTDVDLTNLAGVTVPEDPEPEFVDISSNNIAAITLQENNAIVLIDLATATVIRSFSAGSVDLNNIDTVEDDVINQTSSLNGVPREPDGITFIGTDYIATADEGDWNGGSRGFTIYDLEGNIVYTSGNELDQIAAQVGHYPEARSENKGNEPENIEFATYNDTDYLFVNSERSSLVFVYNVDDPTNPQFVQVLPAGVAPEGGKAIPERNLLVVASEADSRGDVIRSVINIYEMSETSAMYPTLQSVNGENGVPIPWSAMSGLAAGADNTLYAVEDSFYASNRFFTIDTSTTPATLTTATTIKDTNGIFALLEPDLVNPDNTINIDPEGIADTGNGSLWIASEGAGAAGDAGQILNYLFKVNAIDGAIEEVVTLPDEINAKQIRFGLEGVAYDNGQLVVVLQRAWTGDANPRVLVYDTNTSQWVGDYFYPLDAVESQNGGWVGLSDISPLGNGNFLVIERDNQGGPDAAIKRLYSIDLSEAENGDTLEKQFVRDLIPAFTATGGLMPEKLEGLAVTEDAIWVINDNDGVDDNSGETQLVKLDFIFGSGAINLNLVGTYATGKFDEGAAEIPAFDPSTNRLFVVNAESITVDVLDLSDPSNPVKIGEIDASALGGVARGGANSVAVKNGIVAIALEASNGTDNGSVAFFNSNSDFNNPVNPLNTVTVGALPDMVTFTPDGMKVLTANEGEPNDDYSVDPEGSISIIDISAGVANATVTNANFNAFDAQKDDLIAQGVRIFGLNASVSQDLEPEYIAVSSDSQTAYVTLQENNALAVVDIATGTVSGIVPLGFKDHSLPENSLDVSNRDGFINIENWPVFGMYQPDAIASYEVNGQTYLITANEGDARIRPDGGDNEGEVFNEENRVKDLTLDPIAFPNAGRLQEDEQLGRLNVTNTLGDTDGDGDFDQLYAYGARSFSIWDSNGNLVFDSGNQIEQIVAQQIPDYFNSTNDDNDSFDNRSDDKGPEPEGVTVGMVNGSPYAFIGLERVGGVMVYDIRDPQAPQFVQYINNRDFTVDAELEEAGDLGPEGLVFISAEDSPNGVPLLK